MHRWTCLVLLLSTSTAAMAAEADTAPADAEEILVTATKRAESIQDVPIAVTAIGGSQLDSRNILDLNDLNQVAPSLNISSSASAASTVVRVRGIGTAGLNPGFESAVGVFIDGVYRSRAGHALADLFDLERVEILRGPQGTLFGKNTSAGALNIVTRAPEFDLGGSAEITLGNDNLIRTETVVTGAVVPDKLAFRVSAATHDRDGFMKDVVSGDRYNDRNRWAARGQLLWRPTEALSARLIADYRNVDETCCVAAYRFVGPVGAILRSLGAYQPTENFAEDERLVAVNTAPEEHTTDWGLALEANWDLGPARLTSISGLRRNDVDRAVDPDHSNADILAPLAETDEYDTYTQELRLDGSTGPFDWLVGAYYFDESLRHSSDLLYASQTGLYITRLAPLGDLPTDFAPGTGARERSRQDSDGWALFTRNVWHLNDRLELTAGLRYSKEQKTATMRINDAPIGSVRNDPVCNTRFGRIALGVVCNLVSWTQRRSEDAWTGTASLSYELGSDISAYASYGRGYKAGGFNLDRQAVQRVGGADVDSAQFGAENVDAYELGLKMQLLDRRLTLNTALFHTDYRGYQQFNFTGLRFFVDNLPKVISKGVEVEGSWRAADGVLLNAGVTYADARFGDNLTATPTVLPGARIANSPRWQGAAGVDIDRPLTASLDWQLSLNLFFQGPTYLVRSPTLTVERDVVTTVNAQVGIATNDDRLRFSIWARNLFDEVYPTNVFNSVFQAGSQSAYVSAPRSVGVTLATRF